jgi:hypothetical protein
VGGDVMAKYDGKEGLELDNDAMKKAILELKEASKHFIELMHHIAKNNWTLYEEYIQQGFTKEQALELVCKTGLSLKQNGQ